jgi:hypothetical protein
VLSSGANTVGDPDGQGHEVAAVAAAAAKQAAAAAK